MKWILVNEYDLSKQREGISARGSNLRKDKKANSIGLVQ